MRAAFETTIHKFICGAQFCPKSLSLSLSLFVTPDQNIVPRSSPFVNVLDLPREEPPTTRTTIIQAQ